MRFIHTAMTLLMILSVCCIVPVAAHPAAEPIVNLEILTSEDISDIFRAPPIDGSVTQGQTKYHTYYVSSGKKTLEVQLSWNRATGNNLDLVIQPPNQASIEVHDSDDGMLNGNSGVKFTLPEQLTGAYWDFNVQGMQVTGTQSYTLTINAY